MRGCDLHLQERPMHDKLLHLDCFQSFAHGKYDLERIGHGFLCSPSLCISFSSYWPDNILCFLEVSHICGREGLPFLMTYSGIERRSNVYSMKPRLATVSYKRCPHVQWTMPSLQYDRHALHCVLVSVSSNSNSSTLPTS